MFEKSKVKSYNRLSKSKSGFKVVRVKDFLRKRDEKDNTVRNTVLGVAAISTLGIGTALLLKKKGGIKFPGKLAEKNLLTKVNNKLLTPKQKIPLTNKVVDVKTSIVKKIDNVVTPTGKKNDIPELRDFWNTKNTPGTKMLENGDRLLKVSKRTSGIRKKTGFSQISDPWSTSIKSPIKKTTEKIVQETENIKLLPSAIPLLKPKSRGNLLKPKSNSKVEESLVNMRNTQKNYGSLPLPMKVTLQMEKALTRPIKSSNLGKQLDTKGLKVILGDSEKLPIEKVISKAKRKVGDRLKRQNEELAKKNLMT